MQPEAGCYGHCTDSIDWRTLWSDFQQREVLYVLTALAIFGLAIAFIRAVFGRRIADEDRKGFRYVPSLEEARERRLASYKEDFDVLCKKRDSLQSQIDEGIRLGHDWTHYRAPLEECIKEIQSLKIVIDEHEHGGTDREDPRYR